MPDIRTPLRAGSTSQRRHARSSGPCHAPDDEQIRLASAGKRCRVRPHPPGEVVEDSIRDTDEPEHRLKKNLSGLDLTVFGVGVIIGTGIFVLTGEVAQTQAGPAVAGSFVMAG